MTNTIDSVKEKIVNRCNSHWSENKRVYLLARIGIDLHGEVDFIKTTLGMKLVDFVRNEMRDVVNLASPNKASPIYGIFPKHVSIPSSELPYFFEQPKKIESVRFNSRVWAAFTRSIPNGCHRIFFIDTLHFEDSLVAVQSSDNIMEIPSDLVVSEETENRAEAVAKNIVKWATDSRITLDSLLVSRSGKLNYTSQAPYEVDRPSSYKKSFRQDDASLLARLIQSLDHKEMSRVSLPLDIVQKLMETKA
ncbi:hypothetical protein GGE65_006203 [Skermanella aerolata]|uniref:hypothetical protein n=1 Tax=Skermanella aerolata TaxID=393310 RepID=UPI003D242106